MTWFAKCHGADCSVREQCRRFVDPADPFELQPWFHPATPGPDCPKRIPIECEDDGA